jgi:hypothetical protein
MNSQIAYKFFDTTWLFHTEHIKLNIQFCQAKRNYKYRKGTSGDKGFVYASVYKYTIYTQVCPHFGIEK